ncbi:MAG: PEP-utilizing enzyme [archaeon]|nr:PEP-utilizing enzyme [archaeon]MCK9439572.1 PEP-utilizing enzyme [Patescibacteria group bacterium]
MILKGIVASKSIKGVSGKIRIINKNNISSFKKGEILVSYDTNPNYLVAMKKSKAILTESGGLLSHAAIVSRELNIPCIVNIKSITKKLKNEQFVKINFEKGEIEY